MTARSSASRRRAQLDHYLDLLARKPGALRRALPLAQARERGEWPTRVRRALATARRTRSAALRPRARWSTCCCSAASTPPEEVAQCRRRRARGGRDRRARGAVLVPPHERAADRLERVMLDQRVRPGRACRHRRSAPTTSCSSAIGATPDGRPDDVLEALIRAHTRELKLPTIGRRYQRPRGRGDTHPADPDRLPRRAARSRGRGARRAARAPPPHRRALPARQAPRGLPLRRQPQDPDQPRSPRSPTAATSTIASRSSSSATPAPARPTSRPHSAIRACSQGRRVRFTTLAALANELQEAESRRELARVVAPLRPHRAPRSSTSSATSRCPTAPPSSSSKSSPNATNAPR